MSDATDLQKYARQLELPGFGLKGQKKLRDGRVVVVGAGGLGSPILLYLAAAGVGHLTIVDPDCVEATNLHRQVIHTWSRIGVSKAVSAARSINDLNPDVKVVPISEAIVKDNAREILSGHDLVIDGSDNFITRYLVNDAATLQGIPYVWGAVYQLEGQAAVFWDSEQSPNRIDLRDLYASPPPPEEATSCSVGGVLGTVCLSVAGFMAGEALKLLSGMGGVRIGQLQVFDAFDFTWRHIQLKRSPNRMPVTALGDYEALCGVQASGQTAYPIETPETLMQRLRARDQGEDNFVLIDIREEHETLLERIEGALNLPLSAADSLRSIVDISNASPVILYCASGIRSKRALRECSEQGAKNLAHLEGGILAWTRSGVGTFAQKGTGAL